MIGVELRVQFPITVKKPCDGRAWTPVELVGSIPAAASIFIFCERRFAREVSVSLVNPLVSERRKEVSIWEYALTTNELPILGLEE